MVTNIMMQDASEPAGIERTLQASCVFLSIQVTGIDWTLGGSLELVISREVIK